MADPLDAVGRLAAAGVPFALAGPWAVDATLGRALRAGAAAVVVPAGREAEAVAVVGGGGDGRGGAVEVRAWALEEGDVVDVAVAGRALPCLRPELLLLALVDPSPSPTEVADARALAAATGLSLPPLPASRRSAGTGGPARGDAVADTTWTGGPARGDAVADSTGTGGPERCDAVAGLQAAPPALVPPAAAVAAGPSGGPEPVEVRDAVAADLPALAAVHTATWRAAYAGHMPAAFLARIDPVRRWRQWLGWFAGPDRRGHLLVTGGPGIVDGFAMCGPGADGGPDGEVHAVYCHPSAWGTGRGRALLVEAERRLRDDGFGAAVLWVLAGNERARRFYEVAGWAPDGEVRSDEVGPPGDRVAVGEVRYRVVLR